MNKPNEKIVLNIHTTNSVISIGDAIHLLEYDEIQIPDSIRYGESWSLEQQRLYIESMLLGFPVSSFIAVQNHDGRLKVVDGVKRFKALIGFLNDDFNVTTNFRWTSEDNINETIYSYLSKEGKRYVNNIRLHFFIHTFDNLEDASNFEKRLHADFEILARKITIIDRYLSFDNDSYSEAIVLISTFNSYLAEKYPETKITVKIQQEGDKLRLIVEAEDGIHIEAEQILNDFNKGILRKLQSIEEVKERNFKQISQLYPSVHVNVKNENTITNNVSVNVELRKLLNKNNGLINELIEELESSPEIVDQLKKIISSSESITHPQQLESSAFLSRATRFAEQVKDKGSTLYHLIKTSKECADIVKKIMDNLQTFSNWL
ncbi:DUF262 domain-containing protein [Aeromonas veronii]